MKAKLLVAAISFMAATAHGSCFITRAGEVFCPKDKVLKCTSISKVATLNVNLGGSSPAAVLSYALNASVPGHCPSRLCGSDQQISLGHTSQELGFHKVSVQDNHVQLLNPQGEVDFELSYELTAVGQVQLNGLYIKGYYSNFDQTQLANTWQCTQ